MSGNMSDIADANGDQVREVTMRRVRALLREHVGTAEPEILVAQMANHLGLTNAERELALRVARHYDRRAREG